MDELARVFGRYREALPDPDVSGDFMPGMWRRIESRRASHTMLRRFTEAFVTFAAALALLIGVVLIPYLQREPVYSASYVDVLAAEHSTDAGADSELLPVDTDGRVR